MRAIKLKEDGNGLHEGILVLSHLILLQFCKAHQLSYGMPWNCFGSQQVYQAQSTGRHSAIAGSVYSNKILNRSFYFVCPLVLSSVSSYIVFRHRRDINAHLPFAGQVSFFGQRDSLPGDSLLLVAPFSPFWRNKSPLSFGLISPITLKKCDAFLYMNKVRLIEWEVLSCSCLH